MKYLALPILGFALFVACNSMDSQTNTNATPVKGSAGTDSKPQPAARRSSPTT